VQSFIEQHRPLILRHAREMVRRHPEKCAAEDVAREMELELEQLEKNRGLTPEKVHSPDPYIRVIAKHALGRAKRRRALLEQLAAGDDLDALSKDITVLDSDLPPLPPARSPDGEKARATLERLKDALAPKDALIVALLFEDDASLDDVAVCLTMPLEEVAYARERILSKAASLGIEADAPPEDRRGPT
jgi:DNA-directed RNA polymerase specialized sigma24 family protein